MPTPAQLTALAHCDGEALLYGIGRPVDVVAARLCAFAQRSDPANGGDPSGLFDGDGLLMTIYANGLGVARQRDVAMHLACGSVASAPAEREARVAHLAAMTDAAGAGTVFSPCDDITSGYQETVCAVHARRLADVARSATLDSFASGLSPVARARFASLRKTQAAWAEARTGELDMSGSARGAIATAEQDLQDTDFADMIGRLRHGAPPPTGPAQLRAAGARIEAALRILLARPAGPVPGEVTPAGIRKAQQAWTAYRDAWGDFAAVAYPRWGSAGAQAWVSMKRADMLGRMASQP